ELLLDLPGTFPGIDRTMGQSVDQTSGLVTLTEGQTVSLSCSYEAQYTGEFDTYWYSQHPGQPLKYLLDSSVNKAQGFQATYIPHGNKLEGTFNMQKPAIQLNDSDAYFCAFRDTI
uniref:Ig-like domain-containing protein n=1 Tax=Laticauda laticaudata TaxID=8630 RepID=A0A8C5S614_LATLA